MNYLLKLVKANVNHKTRFHTERGDLMPFRAFLRIPMALLNRITGKCKIQPWIVPEAIYWLKQNMGKEWQVFEFGCGWSTIWYAKHCYKIVSIEDNQNWYDIVKQRILKQKVQNCDLRMVKLDDFITGITSFPDAYFDLVIVDSSEVIKTLRIDAVKAAMLKVKPGGYILLDDSDRPQYESVPKYLRGWVAQSFVGVKPIPLMAIETTIFQRPVE